MHCLTRGLIIPYIATSGKSRFYPLEIKPIKRVLPEIITEATALSGTPNFSAISVALIMFTKCKVSIKRSSSGKVAINSAIVFCHSQVPWHQGYSPSPLLSSYADICLANRRSESQTPINNIGLTISNTNDGAITSSCQ